MSTLSDPFGRTISYLRLSVTDRCDLRCRYCMTEHMQFLPKRDLLTLEELDRLATAFVALGTRKLRITGGEPLVRKNIISLFRAMSRHLESGALDELTLTTNGTQLARHAAELVDCGVKRINVSLDTLDAEKFAHVTRWGRLEQVLEGVAAAKAAGLRVKINTVALKGFNEEELFALVDWCAAEGHDLTFIELMPMGEFDDALQLSQYWPLSDVRARLASRFTIEPLSERTGGPATYVRLVESGQKVGFITPLTHNFCESCNRVRVTCTGDLFTCLGQEGRADLRAPLRAGPDDDLLVAAIRDAIAHKPRGHDFDYSRTGVAGRMSRTMSHTGG
ncbi:GTP 3',8-cyclase MoaA [Phaeovulum sp.]|uniref:GTP 3',8-cyclase MoaA n=1 Tax=Phaeovulum sp. TaxID=2934796 RepID=UPI0035615A72